MGRWGAQMDKKAQDNNREDLQKKRFGLVGEHTRDATYDAFYKIPIDFKTKAADKGCTTKRRYSGDPFSNCVLIVSNYIDKETISDTDWVVFPPALLEWRKRENYFLTMVLFTLTEMLKKLRRHLKVPQRSSSLS